MMVTPKRELDLLDDRDPRQCVITGYRGPRVVPQHRQGGMGGSKTKHQTHKLLWIDSIVNGIVEADPFWQTAAKAWGVKVPGWVTDVSRVPVFYRHDHAWFTLAGDSREEVSAIVALDMMHDVYGDPYLGWKAAADDTEHTHALLEAWTPF